jgi:recombination protein RecA
MDEKEKALEAAMLQVTRTFGKGSVMKMGESVNKITEESIPTGIFSLDIALGIGGIPRGRVIEIYGSEGSGKSTIALQMIAEVQKRGGKSVYIDAEHAMDPSYAQALGINLADLVISQPDYGEQALEIAEILIRSGAVDLVVIDSVAALVPKAELDGNMGDSQMGLQARLMSQAMRKLTAVLNKSGCSCIFINQLREKIGIVFGNPETTTGGRALKFYSSIRMEVKRGELIKEGENTIGQEVKVKIVKNKVAPPYKSCVFDLMYGKGISHISGVIDLAIQNDLIKKSGSWYSYEDNKIGQGIENVKKYLTENTDLLKQFEAKIQEIYNLKVNESK